MNKRKRKKMYKKAGVWGKFYGIVVTRSFGGLKDFHCFKVGTPVTLTDEDISLKYTFLNFEGVSINNGCISSQSLHRSQVKKIR
jgi:hypothetical protein